MKKVICSRIARNSVIYTTDFVLQMFVQAAYAILISSKLGPSSYGVFSSITAVSIIASVFSGWGCDQTLIAKVSVEKGLFQKTLGSGLSIILLTYPALLAISFSVLHFTIPPSRIGIGSLLLMISMDLLFTKVIFLAKACFVVFERAKGQLVINLFTTITRLLFLFLALTLSSEFTLNTWSIWYFSSGLISAGFSLMYTAYNFGTPQFSNLKAGFISGMQFCIEQASLAALKDLDKPIVVAVMNSEQAGYYAAAFKLVDAASSPIRGMLYAAYVRYFKFCRTSERDGIAFSFKVLPYLVIGSLIIAVLIYSLAWVLPMILGEKYRPAISIVQQLSLYPLLIGLLGTGVDLLRGIGRQLTRIYIMIGSSLATAPVLYLFLDLFGIAGAAGAKIAVLAATVTTVWWVIVKIRGQA